MTELYSAMHDFAGPAATIVAAIAIVWATWQFNRRQAETAEYQADLAATRLRHDLYDRRIAIFDAVYGALRVDLPMMMDVSDSTLSSFLKVTVTSRFIFPEVSASLDEMSWRLLKLQIVNQRICGTINEINIQMFENEREEIVKWFDGKFDLICQTFDSVMRLEVPIRRGALH